MPYSKCSWVKKNDIVNFDYYYEKFLQGNRSIVDDDDEDDIEIIVDSDSE